MFVDGGEDVGGVVDDEGRVSSLRSFLSFSGCQCGAVWDGVEDIHKFS